MYKANQYSSPSSSERLYMFMFFITMKASHIICKLVLLWFGLIPLTPIAELCKLGQNVLSRVGQYDDIIPKLR